MIAEIAQAQSSGEPLTHADYISTPCSEWTDFMRMVCELGVVASMKKNEKYMDAPIELYQTNVSFDIDTQEGIRHYNVHRNKREKTQMTQYYVLDCEQVSGLSFPKCEFAAEIVGSPRARPWIWFKKENRNKKAQAYFVDFYYDCGKVMLKPTKEFYQTLTLLAQQEGGISKDVTNFYGDEPGVEVTYYEARNATRLHPITGKAPFWHPLHAECGANVRDIWEIQQQLDRK